jgi:RNA polymerase sigma-70 factor (ECF subfamily)
MGFSARAALFLWPSAVYMLPELMSHGETEGRNTKGWETDPDVALMMRVREGDSAVFRDLFAKHSKGLINFAYRYVHNRERAEELAQEVFLQIFRARNRYEPKAKFATYLYRVATNLCLNELRRFDYKGKIEPLEGNPVGPDNKGARELPDESLQTAEASVTGREIQARVEKVLSTLPENQKSALLLSRVEGFTYQEVAESLGTSESAVKSLIFRATKTLRQKLKDLVPR